MDVATTERTRVTFIVKEYGEGRVGIALEPADGRNLPAVGDGFLGLDLKAGTTYEQAQEIARYLNEWIIHVSHTRFYPKTGQTKPF